MMNTDGTLLLLIQVLVTPAPNVPRLVRYTVDGVVDAAFASDLSVGGEQYTPVKIAAGTGGKIYVLLWRSATAYFLLRLNADGSRDTSFGPAGARSISLERLRQPSVSGLSELGTGKIFLTGTFESTQFQNDMFTARLNLDGNLDRTFGLQGLVRFSIPNGMCQMTTSVVQPDGKPLVAGAYTFLGSYALMVRLTGRGRPDTTFGTGGASMYPFQDVNVIEGVSLTADGHILVVGRTSDKTVPTVQQMFVARFTPTGVRESFAEMTFSANVNAGAFGVTQQPDGKIVTAGYSSDAPGGFLQFAVARFLP
jgi:uncharacterized delta-60 repeat protein